MTSGTSQIELHVNTNPLLRESTLYSFPDQQNTHFHFDIALQSPTTATIKNEKVSIDLYLLTWR